MFRNGKDRFFVFVWIDFISFCGIMVDRDVFVHREYNECIHNSDGKALPSDPSYIIRLSIRYCTDY